MSLSLQARFKQEPILGFRADTSKDEEAKRNAAVLQELAS